jgi:hypothetical protein
MEGIKNAVRGLVPEAISLGLGSISNKDTWNRAMRDFRVVSGDKCESTAPNFS